MADRIFAGVLFVVALAYAVIAFTSIQAPFQYDPLGPESWPQLLSIIALLCIAHVIYRPDVDDIGVSKDMWFKLGFMVLLMVAYAELFERLGFVIATTLYAAAASKMLGATRKNAAIFGVISGLGGYVLCAVLLDMNLPFGEWIEPIFFAGEN